MKKSRLIKCIIDSLAENLSVLEKAARASHAEATHESSKAENKYDTRGLEAAYLAGGQARQVREIAEAIQTYQKLTPKDFKPGETIEMTALVELTMDGSSSTYFVGPKSGGLEVTLQKTEVMVITPQSPLGSNLMGKKAGDKWSVKAGATTARYHILSVQ